VLSGSSRCDALPEELIDDVSDVAGNLGEAQAWKAMEKHGDNAPKNGGL